MAKKLQIMGAKNADGKTIPPYGIKAKGWGPTRGNSGVRYSPKGAAADVVSATPAGTNNYSKALNNIGKSNGQLLKDGIVNMAKKLKGLTKR